MKSLIFIVEEDINIKNMLLTFLNASDIDFLFASNAEEATKLFKDNERSISHIAIDGRISMSKKDEELDTECLAKIIASSTDFKGEVFVMSSDQIYNDILMYIIGDKCESIVDSTNSIKQDTIKEIIRRITKKRKRG